LHLLSLQLGMLLSRFDVCTFDAVIDVGFLRTTRFDCIMKIDWKMLLEREKVPTPLAMTAGPR
jgi:hypothetical protein